ncbi:MAG: ABC transporter permease subunit, partial [Phycisphaerae bacterium]|nr:ABC transporter permease subunit [Phycisphaerae bacterium]
MTGQSPRLRRAGPYLLAGLCLLIFLAFLIWPMLLTISGGFQSTGADGSVTWTLAHVAAVFEDPVLREGLVNSLQIGVLVTLLSLLIALPLAVVATSFEFRGKAILSALLLVPLILPPFVGAIGLRQLLGRFGSVNSLLIDMGWVDAAHPIDFLGGGLLGVVIAEALHLYPIIYLNATAALANLDPALEQAAENLGASRWTRFRRVTLPLILPGLFAGGIIVFIWSFTELGTPLMFDYYTVTPVQVFWGIQEMADSPRPYALVAVMLLTAVMLYTLGKLVFGGRAYAMATRAASAAVGRRLDGGRGLLAAAPFALITFLAVLPHIGVVLASVTEPGSWYFSALPTDYTSAHYLGALTHPLASGSIRNSLVYSTAAMLLDIGLGLLIAWLVVRGRVVGGQLLDGLAMLPLAVPGLVLAFGYVAMTLHWPFPQLAAFFGEQGWDGLASMMQVTGESPDPILFLVIAYAI